MKFVYDCCAIFLLIKSNSEVFLDHFDETLLFTETAPVTFHFSFTNSECEDGNIYCIYFNFVHPTVYLYTDNKEHSLLDTCFFFTWLYGFLSFKRNFCNERNVHSVSFLKLRSSTFYMRTKILYFFFPSVFYFEISGKIFLPLFLWLHYITLPTLLLYHSVLCCDTHAYRANRDYEHFVLSPFSLVLFLLLHEYRTRIKSVNWICFLEKQTAAQ